jgi:hypothetical protein
MEELKWSVKFRTEPVEVDTGHNDAAGERVKFTRLGTVALTLGDEMKVALHVHDCDSLHKIAKKFEGVASRIYSYERRAVRKGLQPFHKKLAAEKLEDGDLAVLNDVAEAIKEIVHE